MKKRFLFVSVMVFLFCSLNAVLLTIFQESQSPTSSLQSKEKRNSEVINYTHRPSGEPKTTEEHKIFFVEPQRIVKVLSADAFPLMLEIDLHIMESGTFAGYAFRGLEGLTYQCKYTVDSPMKLKLSFERENTGNGKKRKVYKGKFVAKAKIHDETHEVILPILIIADESGK